MNEKISVIIRTKNEERFIGHAIQSILDKINKPEIIILDNDSNDQTLQIVRLFSQDKNQQLLFQKLDQKKHLLYLSKIKFQFDLNKLTKKFQLKILEKK